MSYKLSLQNQNLSPQRHRDTEKNHTLSFELAGYFPRFCFAFDVLCFCFSLCLCVSVVNGFSGFIL